MPGLKNSLEELGLAVQYCQFHQVAIVRRYLTNNPRLEPNKELKAITLSLKNSTERQFRTLLDEWHSKYEEWLNEKEINRETGRLRYFHQRTRSAHLSLVRNLDNLFTFESYPELYIPKTNNRIEGYFSNLKQSLNCHRSLSKKLKTKMIFNFIRGTTEQQNNHFLRISQKSRHRYNNTI